MSDSQAQSPHRDVSGRFVHDAKDDSGVTWTSNGTSNDPHASHCCPPDLESEETTAHGAPDARSVAPNHIITRYVISHADHAQAQDDEPTLPVGPDRAGPHVRFRSRVRISAGIGRRFRLSDGFSSNASSISGSSSSSISAPLRTHYTGNNGWGPLGSRVKLSAPQGKDASGGKGNPSGRGDGNARRRRARSSRTFPDNDADEHTHLLTYATMHSYVGNGYTHDCYHDDAERERWWRERLVNEAFGKWPGRLLNRHWWWWHLEPILCCFCGPDEE